MPNPIQAAHRFLPAAALLLALCAAACGDTTSPASSGDDSAAAGSEMAGCSAELGPTDPTLLIDDIEDADGNLANVGGRNGLWWLSTDETAGTITPPANAQPIPERIVGGRCGSTRALRMSGQGFSAWGAVLTAVFRYTTEEVPSDFSAFRGVMFWARVGETNTGPVRVQFQDANTQPAGGRCVDTPGSPDECYNGFGVELVPLGREWRLYKLDFSRMAQQEGFGYRAPALDTTNLYNIGWTVTANSVFDLWVDDLWLYE